MCGENLTPARAYEICRVGTEERGVEITHAALASHKHPLAQ